ncbi:Thiamine pyrophosphokinase [bioreactor metagenome]|uniref:Thiamine pyrophosphokinase n=1 Tax=bioreactor metagenome TaxID=1076179 RepID=A0A644WAA9_9ZZZZ
MKSCYIVGAGDFQKERFHPNPGDFVIAADAGFDYLEGLSIEPDFVIGDFDSLKSPPRDPRVITLPTEKDDTDLLYAVKHARKEGCDTFYLFGGTGGRLDHTLANIQVLSYLSVHGSIGFLLGSGYVITAIRNSTLRFDPGYRGILSVFCAGDRAEGVFLRGLKYPLSNATLTNEIPLGVSNEFLGIPVEVSVSAGTLTVYWEDCTKLPLPAINFIHNL